MLIFSLPLLSLSLRTPHFPSLPFTSLTFPFPPPHILTPPPFFPVLFLFPSFPYFSLSTSSSSTRSTSPSFSSITTPLSLHPSSFFPYLSSFSPPHFPYLSLLLSDNPYPHCPHYFSIHATFPTAPYFASLLHPSLSITFFTSPNIPLPSSNIPLPNSLHFP